MLRKGWYLLILFTCCSACVVGVGDKRKRNNGPLPWHLERKAHVGMQLSPEDLQHVVAIGNETHFFDTLKPILTTRVVDTPGHAAVRQFIVNQMENLGWTVEQHRFEDHTPLGAKNFTNIVATLQPSVPRRLVLACHYDSKLTPEGFLGAIDSAVPCAMLINLAYTLRKRLTEFKAQPSNVTLQFLFFDGEEALVTWNDHDSLYGSRRLAQKWHQTPFPLGGSRDTSELHRIDLFVLLDLIGTKDTSFYSFFRDSEQWYSSLVDFEKILERGGALKTRPLFRNQKFHGMGIEDDHIPFMRKGVPILHLIGYPFPSVWHKMSDNFESLDPATIENMNTIMRAFVVHYLHLTRP